MATVAERLHEGDSEWFLDEDPVNHLVADLAAVGEGSAIRMFVGEGRPGLYNHPDFLWAARSAKQDRRVMIRIITGPLIITDESGFNGLLRLVEDRLVDEIYPLPERGEISPFRVIEDLDGGLLFCKELPVDDPLSPTPRYFLNLDLLSP